MWFLPHKTVLAAGKGVSSLSWGAFKESVARERRRGAYFPQGVGCGSFQLCLPPLWAGPLEEHLFCCSLSRSWWNSTSRTLWRIASSRWTPLCSSPSRSPRGEPSANQQVGGLQTGARSASSFPLWRERAGMRRALLPVGMETSSLWRSLNSFPLPICPFAPERPAYPFVWMKGVTFVFGKMRIQETRRVLICIF